MKIQISNADNDHKLQITELVIQLINEHKQLVQGLLVQAIQLHHNHKQ